MENSELIVIPMKEGNIMRSMYEGSESCVSISQGQTDFFSVNSGMRLLVPSAVQHSA